MSKDYRFIEKLDKLPAGRYLFTDPCYVLGEEPFWSDLVIELNSEDVPKDVVFVEMKGKVFPIFKTSIGDGLYSFITYDGCVSSPVDSGCLAFVPVSLVKDEDLESGGVFTLYKDEKLKFPERGVVEVGIWQLDTRPELDYEDEEEEEEEY